MSQPARPKRSAPRPLADLVGACLGPVLAKQGFAGADILVNWPEIVGEAMARRSRPIRLAWPRKPGAESRDRPPEPATLHVRVESLFALDLQHLAPLVIERVNGYFGWACVGRLRLEQGPVGRDKRPSAVKEPSLAAVAAAEAVAGDLADQGLRAALIRLGAAVIDRDAVAAAPNRDRDAPDVALAIDGARRDTLRG